MEREARAFRIWQIASARDWEVCGQDIAEIIGLPERVVLRICEARGWRLLSKKRAAAPALPEEIAAFGLSPALRDQED